MDVETPVAFGSHDSGPAVANKNYQTACFTVFHHALLKVGARPPMILKNLRLHAKLVIEK